MPKSGSRRNSLARQKRVVGHLGLPDSSSLRRFVAESETQRRIRKDRSMEPRLVKRDEV